MTRPTESVLLVTRLRAARLGTYPSRRIAFSTVLRVAGLTRVLPFTTREAVARETPAASATASSVFASTFLGCSPGAVAPICESALTTVGDYITVSRPVNCFLPGIVENALTLAQPPDASAVGRSAL